MTSTPLSVKRSERERELEMMVISLETKLRGADNVIRHERERVKLWKDASLWGFIACGLALVYIFAREIQ